MKIKPGTPLNVKLNFGQLELSVGRLALDSGIAVLEYSQEFLASGLSINPILGTPTTLLVRAKGARLFDGLHGIFADSLPDAWGEILVQRRAEANGVPYSSLTVLDKLAIVGTRGMGALTYHPEVSHHPNAGTIDLEVLAGESLRILQGAPSDVLTQIEELGGSSGGARPKVLVGINDADEIVSGTHDLPDGFNAWIVKFRDSRDVEDIGPLEATYAAMARAAGLEMSQTKLLPSRTGPGYFATRRFDRGKNGSRVHVASAAGLLDTEWAVPTIDYDMLLKLTMAITRQHGDVEKMFRRLAFNVIAYNRDDHSKQHSFLMNAQGIWTLAPAYDLTFSSGAGGEHYLAVNGKGSNITVADLSVLGKSHGISQKLVDDVVGITTEAVGQFGRLAKDYGVSKRTASTVQGVLNSQIAAFTQGRARASKAIGRNGGS